MSVFNFFPIVVTQRFLAFYLYFSASFDTSLIDRYLLQAWMWYAQNPDDVTAVCQYAVSWRAVFDQNATRRCGPTSERPRYKVIFLAYWDKSSVFHILLQKLTRTILYYVRVNVEYIFFTSSFLCLVLSPRPSNLLGHSQDYTLFIVNLDIFVVHSCVSALWFVDGQTQCTLVTSS